MIKTTSLYFKKRSQAKKNAVLGFSNNLWLGGGRGPLASRLVPAPRCAGGCWRSSPRVGGSQPPACPLHLQDGSLHCPPQDEPSSGPECGRLERKRASRFTTGLFFHFFSLNSSKFKLKSFSKLKVFSLNSSSFRTKLNISEIFTYKFPNFAFDET